MSSDSGSWFSPKRFVVALLAIAMGTAAGKALVPVFGGYAGLLFGGFAAGLAFEDRPFLEAGVAGVFAGVAVSVLGSAWGLVFGGLGVELLLLGAVLGFGLGGLGAHFGNDFRDGLTRPVES